MELLRNREIRYYLLGTAVLGLAGLGICFAFDTRAGIAATALFAALTALSIAFTRRRYRKLAELSDCLGRIAAGDYTVDLREYRDGELSILKSELYKVTRTLSHQAEALGRDKAFLADSISDISHQLKTPLTSVTMMTELLAAPGLPEEKRSEFLTGIALGLERIRWLIASLLKLSRLDAGEVTMRTEPVSAPRLVEAAAQPLRIPMELKAQTFSTTGDAAVTFPGDLPWLTEALGNLLKNCVEHTPAGGHIGVEWERNPLYTRITVRDDGPGIAPEDLPHIFERFYRGKNAGPDSVGIGLALAKSIIQNQGGTIQAQSEEGKGTRFTIKLYKSTR